MVEDTADESVLDTEAEKLIRQMIQGSIETTPDHGFDIPVEPGVYVGFNPTHGPQDIVGHLYIYITDLVYHQRTDELGRPYADTTDVYNQSKSLNVLSNELRHLLYEELGCDHTFSRDESTEHGGGVCYATTVTASASVLDSLRVPDDEL